MTDSGCYICGCVRNCAAYLPRVFENIRNISTIFATTTIIIAYDESSDNSFAILQEFASQFPNLIILQNRNPMSRIRTENIANARNSILDEIRRIDCSDSSYNFFIMMDMDDVCASPINVSVLSRYLSDSEVVRWDSLSFNRAEYYDIWALSIAPYLISCWHWNNNPMVQFMNRDVVVTMNNLVSNKLANLKQDELLECFSAFNGFAIYKLSHFLDCRYDYNIFSNLKLIPVSLIQHNITVLGKPFYTYFVEDCEHRHFHFQSIVQHRSKIRISPLLLWETSSS